MHPGHMKSWLWIRIWWDPHLVGSGSGGIRIWWDPDLVGSGSGRIRIWSGPNLVGSGSRRIRISWGPDLVDSGSRRIRVFWCQTPLFTFYVPSLCICKIGTAFQIRRTYTCSIHFNLHYALLLFFILGGHRNFAPGLGVQEFFIRFCIGFRGL